MKLGVCLIPSLGIISGASPTHIPKESLQPASLGSCEIRQRETSRKSFQPTANLVDLTGGLRRDPIDSGGASRSHLDKFFDRQPSDSIADRHGTDAKELG
jgi:hypothetical protein